MSDNRQAIINKQCDDIFALEEKITERDQTIAALKKHIVTLEEELAYLLRDRDG